MKYISDIELMTGFVNPVYMFLMRPENLGNIRTVAEEKFIADFKSIIQRSNDDIIKQLIWDSNWRASLTGAWIAFAKNKKEFIDDIGYFMLQGKGGVGYCYALAKFGGKESSEIINSYLNKDLEIQKFPKEGFQREAICALLYLDKANSTNYCTDILKADGTYQQFIKFEYMKGHKLANDASWQDLSGYIENFNYAFDLFSSLFSSG